MKINISSSQRLSRTRLAFTMTELMVAMALFVIVSGGIIYSHINGLRFYEITRAKLGASESARISLGLLISEVRAAQKIQVGTGSSSSFTQATAGSAQRGNAIQIYRPDWHATTNSNSWVRYYRDSTTSALYRKPGPAAGLQLIAEYLTNQIVFASTDFTGTNVLTENDNSAVIDVKFQFYQLRYPQVRIGTNQFFEFFQISARVARRSVY
ncbi:MAG TPA: prepilin-type N-terminal cleavage/methylation domain-containing protein [Verrucomicrobiae bacterium]